MRQVTVFVLALCVSAALAAAAPLQEKAVDENGKPIDVPKLVKKVNPAYPAEAKKEKVMGAVVLEILIDQKGKVAEAKAVKSVDDRLSKAAIDAVKQWEYEPAKVEGKPVKVKASVTVMFRLQ